MKKFLIVVLVCFSLIGFVSAKENKLYFTNNGDRLYYQSELFEENIFIKHNDMIPGKEFLDELVVENNTNYVYKLYLKAKEIEQSNLADELLDNIEMKVFFDNEVVYDGDARGKDYRNSNVNLQDAIYIGEYKDGVTGKLVIKTKLKEDYLRNHSEASKIEWEFYASYDELVLPINPDTSKDSESFWLISLLVLSGFIVFFLILLFIINRKLKLSKV